MTGSASGVTALSNGNYVVLSPCWDNGPAADAGAVTWGDGTSGVTGTVTADQQPGGQHRPMIWSAGRDCAEQRQLCGQQSYWNNGAVAAAGAVTWGDGTSGVTGTVSVANSLVGAS